MLLRKNQIKWMLPFCFLFCMCLDEKDEIVSKKLDIVLQDDLEAIIEDVAQDALLEKPYFEVVSYSEYKEGMYSRMAVVDFYFFNSLNMKITRKYRYLKKHGLWDRYYNKYYMTAPEIDETSN